MNLIKSRIQSGDGSVEMIETQFVAIDEKKRRSDCNKNTENDFWNKDVSYLKWQNWKRKSTEINRTESDCLNEWRGERKMDVLSDEEI